MSKLRNVITLLILPALLLAASPPPDPPPELQGSVKVDGLSCPFCAYGLEKKLSGLPAISNLKIYVDEGRADFDIQPGEVLDVDAVRGAVRDGGFTPKWVRLTARGKLQTTGNVVRLVLPSGRRLQLERGAKRDALMVGAGAAEESFVVEGAARTDGNVTHLAVESFRALK